MEESMYKYKAVIELDDEKIHAAHIDVEDTYRIVKKAFTDRGIDDISEGKQLVFAIKTSEDWGMINAVFYLLWKSWARPYLKIMELYDLSNRTVDNIIASFEYADKRIKEAGI